MLDISKITDQLYVGSQVIKDHADELRLHKFDLIISMIAQVKLDEVYTQAPFNSLWIRTYDNFLLPIPVKKLLQGVEAALPVLQKGGKVLVFCMQGRRRSVIMTSAILIALGYSSKNSAEILMKAREVADPLKWYVRWQIRGFEKYWRKMYPSDPVK